MNQLGTFVTFPAGLVIGGAIADATGDFLLLVTSGIALGAAFGTLTVVLLDVDPRWDLGVGLGSLIGLFLGLLAASLTQRSAARMHSMKRPLTAGLAAGLPLMAAFVVLANALDLGTAITLGLYAATIAIAVFTALLTDARARGIPTRLDRHRSSNTPAARQH